MKLTKANLERTKGNSSAIDDEFKRRGVSDAIIFDDDMKRFGLRQRASGHRSWVVQYETKAGYTKRITLGSFNVLTPEQARHLAKQELAKVELGADPAKERAEAKIKEKQLFKSVVEQYLQAREIDLRKGELRQTSFSEITRYLTKTFKRLDRMSLASIQRRDIASILTEYKAKTPTAASVARSVLTTFFGWAIGEGFIDENPVAYTNKPEAGKPRDRVLKNEELAAVWNACGDDDYGKIIRLLILTGARRDEIAAMQWRELDRDNRTWTLPPERAKNDRELKLTLPGLAWDIIDSTKRRVLKDHLFGIGKNGFRNWAHPRRSWMSAAVYRTGLTTTCAVRLRRE